MWKEKKFFIGPLILWIPNFCFAFIPECGSTHQYRLTLVFLGLITIYPYFLFYKFLNFETIYSSHGAPLPKF